MHSIRYPLKNSFANFLARPLLAAVFCGTLCFPSFVFSIQQQEFEPTTEDTEIYRNELTQALNEINIRQIHELLKPEIFKQRSETIIDVLQTFLNTFFSSTYPDDQAWWLRTAGDYSPDDGITLCAHIKTLLGPSYKKSKIEKLINTAIRKISLDDRLSLLHGRLVCIDDAVKDDIDLLFENLSDQEINLYTKNGTKGIVFANRSWSLETLLCCFPKPDIILDLLAREGVILNFENIPIDERFPHLLHAKALSELKQNLLWEDFKGILKLYKAKNSSPPDNPFASQVQNDPSLKAAYHFLKSCYSWSLSLSKSGIFFLQHRANQTVPVALKVDLKELEEYLAPKPLPRWLDLSCQLANKFGPCLTKFLSGVMDCTVPMISAHFILRWACQILDSHSIPFSHPFSHPPYITYEKICNKTSIALACAYLSTIASCRIKSLLDPYLFQMFHSASPAISGTTQTLFVLGITYAATKRAPFNFYMLALLLCCHIASFF